LNHLTLPVMRIVLFLRATTRREAASLNQPRPLDRRPIVGRA
jgi:hypothetical protein